MRCAEVPWVKLSGTTMPWRLLLQRIVADRFRGAHALLEVARLHHRLAFGSLGVGGPDARIAIGLQLDLDLDRIALGLARTRLQRCAPCSSVPIEVLDVMADLMRDDIGHARSRRAPGSAATAR